MAGHLALLRGINVGGKNKLPMKELVRICESVGCRAVRTYIQSGNVLFEMSNRDVKALPVELERAILREAGLAVPVVVRSRAELAACVERNPFLAAGVQPDRLHVAFLAQVPSARSVAALDPGRSPPDEFAVLGKDVYLHLPNGVARTKLTNAWLDKQLETASTVRNWRTVTTLLEMLSGA